MVHAVRTKSRKRKENKNSEEGREREKDKENKQNRRRGREPERHEVSRYLRQEIERKDKWWKNRGASGKMQESACRWQIRKSRQELSYRH